MNYPLQDLLDSAVMALNGVTLLSQCTTVITQDDGDIDTELLEALTTLSKISLLVSIYVGDTDSPDASGPILDSIGVMVEVAENVTMNRSSAPYLTALQAVQLVINQLHLYQDPETREVLFLKDPKKPLFKLVEPPAGASTSYQCYFQASAVLAGPTT